MTLPQHAAVVREGRLRDLALVARGALTLGVIPATRTSGIPIEARRHGGDRRSVERARRAFWAGGPSPRERRRRRRMRGAIPEGSPSLEVRGTLFPRAGRGGDRATASNHLGETEPPLLLAWRGLRNPDEKDVVNRPSSGLALAVRNPHGGFKAEGIAGHVTSPSPMVIQGDREDGAVVDLNDFGRL